MVYEQQALEHLSLWCRLHLDWDMEHRPCTDVSCDKGHGKGVWCGKPCECPCHPPKG